MKSTSMNAIRCTLSALVAWFEQGNRDRLAVRFLVSRDNEQLHRKVLRRTFKRRNTFPPEKYRFLHGKVKQRCIEQVPAVEGGEQHDAVKGMLIFWCPSHLLSVCIDVGSIPSPLPVA